MNEQEMQQAFIQYLAQKTGAKTQEELEQVIQKLGEDGLKQAYAQFIQEMQQEQIRAAKFGAKLNYIKSLNGKCPEGTELHYYKAGGRLCRKCMEKKAQGGSMKEDNVIQQFKSDRKNKQINTKNPFEKNTKDQVSTLKKGCSILAKKELGGDLKKKIKSKTTWTPKKKVFNK